jgi:OmpA-OmpF porin, OOP family
MTYTKLWLSHLLCLSLLPTAALAQEDLDGSKDHPAVKRYPGSTIFADYVEKDFEAADLPVSSSRCEHVEGKYYTAVYAYPPKASCTQVLRNYENAFKAANLTLYSGKDLPEGCNTWGVNGSSIERWTTATGTGPKGGKTWIFVGCVEGAIDTAAGPLLVVDSQAMEQKVEVDANYLVGEIEKSGHVAVYGISFATGKADITADSGKALAEIGSLLAKKPNWRFRIEGHTDAVGNTTANLDLSNRRAQAVKDWLVSKHAVKSDRLTTQGFGDTKPIGDNKTAEGKAKNRRVELVKL